VGKKRIKMDRTLQKKRKYLKNPLIRTELTKEAMTLLKALLILPGHDW
jgi:hypothetical protein